MWCVDEWVGAYVRVRETREKERVSASASVGLMNSSLLSSPATLLPSFRLNNRSFSMGSPDCPMRFEGGQNVPVVMVLCEIVLML
jgi:hypothetical protein